jgi:hypothetical protein
VPGSQRPQRSKKVLTYSWYLSSSYSLSGMGRIRRMMRLGEVSGGVAAHMARVELMSSGEGVKLREEKVPVGVE